MSGVHFALAISLALEAHLGNVQSENVSMVFLFHTKGHP